MNKYIGIPFVDRGNSIDGADCYGILRLIYRDALSIELPEFHGSCNSTKLIFSDYLKQIAEHWELVEEPKIYDVVAMAHDPRHPRVIQHFGLYIGDGLVLHTLENIGSHVIKLEELKYYVKGIYRWQK